MGPFADAGPIMGDIDRGRKRDNDIDLGRWEPMNQRPETPIDRNTPGYRGDGWNMGRVAPEYWREDEKPPEWGRGREWVEPGDIRKWEPRRPQPRRPLAYFDDGGMREVGRRSQPRRPYRPPTPPPRPTELSDRLSSDAERMKLLSGESDTIKSPDSSRPLIDNYDPVDVDFNRQFSEAPRGRQPWHSDPTGNPLERDPLSDYDFREGRSTNRRPPNPPGPPRATRQPDRNRRNVKNRR